MRTAARPHAFTGAFGLPHSGEVRQQKARYSAAILLAALACQTSASAQTAQLLVRSGEQATDLSYEVFRRFGSDAAGIVLPAPVLNDQGDVLFFGSLGGPVGATDTAVFVLTNQGFRVAARRFTTVPGYPSGTSFESFPSVLLADNGDAIIKARLTGSSVQMGINDVGVWRSTPTETVQLARTSEFAPQTSPAATYKLLLEPMVTRASTAASLAIPARVKNTQTLTEHDGIWIPGHAQPRRAMQGSVAPGTAGAVFSGVLCVPSSAGPAVYYGELSGGDVQTLSIGGNTFSNASGLWADDGTGLPVLRVRPGMQLTGSATGPVLSSILTSGSDPISTADGSIIFAGTAVHSVTGANLGQGAWRLDNGAIEQVLLSGDLVVNAPGLSADSILSTATAGALHDSGGKTIVVSRLSGAGVTYLNETALLESSASGLMLVARARQQAPGCPSGQIFTTSSLAGSIATARSGKWAFGAQVQGAGVTTANDRGIWVVQNGLAELALREGMQISGYLIAEIKDSASSLQISDSGDIIVHCDLVPASNPFGARSAAIVAWSPCRGTSIPIANGRPLQLASGSTANVVNFRAATSGMLNRHGELAAAVKFASAIPDDEAIALISLPGCNPCRADYDNSGVLTVHDIYIFLTNWFRGEADYDNSGATEVLDIFAFLSDWYAGCP